MMPRRRPSSGFYGVIDANSGFSNSDKNHHRRIGHPSSAPKSSTAEKTTVKSRNSGIPQSSADAHSVEQWLTSATIPTRTSSSRSSSTSPRKKITSSSSHSTRRSNNNIQQPGSIPFTHNTPSRVVTKGQRLLHDRIATTCSDVFSASVAVSPRQQQSKTPPRRRRMHDDDDDNVSQRPPQNNVSHIIQQRDGKRFTFDDDEDNGNQAILPLSAVTTAEEEDDDSCLNTIHEEDVDPTSTIVHPRPGMTTPGNSHHGHRNRHHPHHPSSNHHGAAPPPPPPPRPHRPTNATPVAVSIPPTHNSSKQMTRPQIPFVKRHSGPNRAKDADEEELDVVSSRSSSTSTTGPHPPSRRRQTSLGSEGFQQQALSQQQQQQHDDSISCSSSVTRSKNGHVVLSSTNSATQLDRHLIPNHQRTKRTSKSESGQPKSSSEQRRSSAGNTNLINPSKKYQFRFPSMRDLVSLGSDEIPERQQNLRSQRSKSSIHTKGKTSKKTAKAATSPNSCSITAATSGTVLSTPSNDDSRGEDISQLTFPESHATQQTNGVTSRADTEKVQNTSKRGDGMRTMKVHPKVAAAAAAAASKRRSMHIRQPSDEEREKVDEDSRESSKRSTCKEEAPDASTTLNSTETMSAMTALLKKTNRIKLHVYDLVENDIQLDLFGCYFPLGQCFNALNSSLHSMGTGAYHVGIEINGVEYAYGANSTTGLTGVFTCMPKHSPGYQYRQSIDFGNRLTTRNQYSNDGSHRKLFNPVPVDGREVVREMASEYMGVDYDLLRKNCCTFAHDACTRLGVRENEIPTWFHNLAAVGAVTQDAVAPINNAFNCELDKTSDHTILDSTSQEQQGRVGDGTGVQLA